jgi:hypothetical protein
MQVVAVDKWEECSRFVLANGIIHDMLGDTMNTRADMYMQDMQRKTP